MDAGDAERLAEWEGDDEGGEVRGVEDDAAGPEMGEVEVVGVGAGVAEGVDKETGVGDDEFGVRVGVGGF